MVTEPLLRALGIPVWHLDSTRTTSHAASREAQTLAHASLSPVALLLDPRADVGGVAMLRAGCLAGDLSRARGPRSSSRSWARSRRSSTRSATAPTSSTWSTRWGWPRRWDWASRSRMPRHKVVVIDGDGSLLMNLGSADARWRATGRATWCTSSSTTRACSRSAASRPPRRPAPIWPAWRGLAAIPRGRRGAHARAA